MVQLYLYLIKDLTNFIRQKPLDFVEKLDLLRAKEWLLKVEEIMNTLHIHGDEDRFLLASHLFESEAEQ